MKKILLSLGLLALACAANAQNFYDALTYSRSEQIGTARSLGMGNAMVAIGGDLGAIPLNPAGSAATNYSQYAISLGSNISIATTQGTTMSGSSSPYSFDKRYRKTSADFAMPNLGFNLNFDTGRSFGVRSFSLAFVANVSNYYDDNLYASGKHSGTSFAGAMAAQASGIDVSELSGSSAYDYYDWNSVLAYRAGMISTAGSSTDQYVGATEKFTEDADGNREYFTSGALNQSYGRLISGCKRDYIFNFALNISDFAYLGATLGFTTLDYDFDEYIRESPVDVNEFDLDFGDEGQTYFQDLKYQDWYSAYGSGSYFKLGVILTPGRFRIGASAQTPTAFKITETYGASAETNFTDSSFDSSATTPTGEYIYRLSTPWTANLGLAYTFGQFAVLSADYEVDFNSSMRFRAYYDGDDFSDLNKTVQNNAGTLHKLRVGAELRPLDWLSVRGGYNLSALRVGYGGNADIASYTTMNHAATLGLGFSTRGSFYFDLACKALFRAKEYIYPYADYDYSSDGSILHYSPEILSRSQLLTAVFTMGYRF